MTDRESGFGPSPRPRSFSELMILGVDKNITLPDGRKLRFIRNQKLLVTEFDRNGFGFCRDNFIDCYDCQASRGVVEFPEVAATDIYGDEIAGARAIYTDSRLDPNNSRDIYIIGYIAIGISNLVTT